LIPDDYEGLEIKDKGFLWFISAESILRSIPDISEFKKHMNIDAYITKDFEPVKNVGVRECTKADFEKVNAVKYYNKIKQKKLWCIGNYDDVKLEKGSETDNHNALSF